MDVSTLLQWAILGSMILGWIKVGWFADGGDDAAAGLESYEIRVIE